MVSATASNGVMATGRPVTNGNSALASVKPAAYAELKGRLDGFLASGTRDAPVRALSEDEIEKLRSLGYLR